MNFFLDFTFFNRPNLCICVFLEKLKIHIMDRYNAMVTPGGQSLQ